MSKQAKTVISDISVVKFRLQLDIIYTNQEVRTILGVDERLVRKYRDNGMLSFHRVGDKYWYTGADIMDFLNRNRYPAFA